MRRASGLLNVLRAATFVAGSLGVCAPAQATDLVQAHVSPLSGMVFDDPPYDLPVERNFQMALLAASSELGRSCGKMEAYGWRMNKNEQSRVNSIFNNAVERLSSAGYAVEPATLKVDSNEITVFTVDRPNKHFMFLWSAGDPGLVLNLCETNAPLSSTHKPLVQATPPVQVYPVNHEDSPVPSPVAILVKRKSARGNESAGAPGAFSPVGRWIGGYTCSQGYTGGVLDIKTVKGSDFKGVFEFYSTHKNQTVPEGAYTIYGEYDAASHRVLINPGKWVTQPKGFVSTVIVGSFDTEHKTFSGIFQGIEGCTSFEAYREGTSSSKLNTFKKAPSVVPKKAAKKRAIKPLRTESKKRLPVALPLPPKEKESVEPTESQVLPPKPVETTVPLIKNEAPPAPFSSPSLPAEQPAVPSLVPSSTAAPAATTAPASIAPKADNTTDKAEKKEPEKKELKDISKEPTGILVAPTPSDTKKK